MAQGTPMAQNGLKVLRQIRKICCPNAHKAAGIRGNVSPQRARRVAGEPLPRPNHSRRSSAAAEKVWGAPEADAAPELALGESDLPLHGPWDHRRALAQQSLWGDRSGTARAVRATRKRRRSSALEQAAAVKVGRQQVRNCCASFPHKRPSRQVLDLHQTIHSSGTEAIDDGVDVRDWQTQCSRARIHELQALEPIRLITRDGRDIRLGDHPVSVDIEGLECAHDVAPANLYPATCDERPEKFAKVQPAVPGQVEGGN
mmetsp:Transcript_107754/g.211155  ORF Transcript_107754/g.211155 Transcript_107754/m.211155 type:complete len:258 (+) Transcript_107754:159-932(+)